MMLAPDIDETSRLVTTPADITLGDLGDFLHGRGYSLPLSACAPRDRSLLASLREPIGCEATPAHGELIEQCVAVSGALAAGDLVALAPAPRRAIGPDVLRLFLQASEHSVRTVTLRVLGRPEATRTLAISCAQPTAAFAFAARLFARDLLPADMWLAANVLVVRLAGKRQIVSAQANAIAALVKTGGDEVASIEGAPLHAPTLLHPGVATSWRDATRVSARITHAAGFTPFGVSLFGELPATKVAPLWQQIAAHVPGASHGS